MKGKRGKMGSPHSSLMGYGEIKSSKKTIQLGCGGTTYLVGPAGGDEGVVAARKTENIRMICRNWAGNAGSRDVDMTCR